MSDTYLPQFCFTTVISDYLACRTIGLAVIKIYISFSFFNFFHLVFTRRYSNFLFADIKHTAPNFFVCTK